MNVIAELRINRGISQRELASAIGVSPSQIGMLERGQRGLTVPILVALSKFFGVSADVLLGISDFTAHKNISLVDMVFHDDPELLHLLKSLAVNADGLVYYQEKFYTISPQKKEVMRAALRVALEDIINETT